MAQDRIYIRCTVCGEVRGLFGLGAGGGADMLYAITSDLDKWLEEHARHNPRAKPELGIMEFGPASDWFRLESESEAGTA